MRQALDSVLRSLKDKNVQCALAYGTALGFVRENAPIDGDDDIDLFIDIDNIVNHAAFLLWLNLSTTKQAFTKTTYTDRDKPRCFFVQVIHQATKCPIDFYGVTRVSSDLCFDTWERRTYTLDDMFPFDTNQLYPMVANPQNFLRVTYGDDWRTPRPGFKGLTLNQRRPDAWDAVLWLKTRSREFDTIFLAFVLVILFCILIHIMRHSGKFIVQKLKT